MAHAQRPEQAYLDHPWFLEAREALPTQKASPKAGGDHPFQLISAHARWSIHSTCGQPDDAPAAARRAALYLNASEARKLGIEDGAFAELFNDWQRAHARQTFDHGAPGSGLLLPRLGADAVSGAQELQVVDPGR